MSFLSQLILLLIIVSLGFNYSIIPGYIYLSNIISAIISLILFSQLKVSQIIDERRNITVLAFLIFYILLNLSSFEGMKWIYLFIMYYSFSIYFRYLNPSINHILLAYLIGIFLGTIFSFQFVDISLLGYNVLSNEFRGSIDALGGFNTFGLLAAIAIIIAIHFQNIYKNTFLKILLYIPIIFLFYAEISTLSRGGFLTMIVALFFYNLFNNSIKVFFGFMLVALVAISLISQTIDIRNLLDRYLFYDDLTGSGRTELWAYILSIMNNPINILFGYGAGPLNIDTNVMTGSSIAIYAESAHNTYLEIFYQFGILGLSFFLIFLFNISTSLEKIKDSKDKMILKTIFFALLCSMFVDSYFFSLQVAAVFSLFYATFNYGGLDEKFI